MEPTTIETPDDLDRYLTPDPDSDSGFHSYDGEVVHRALVELCAQARARAIQKTPARALVLLSELMTVCDAHDLRDVHGNPLSSAPVIATTIAFVRAVQATPRGDWG